MKIIRKNLSINFKTEAVSIYLSQIMSVLDDTTKKLKNAEEKWNIIKSIFNLVSSSDRPFNFLIFPEVAIPYTHIQEIINIIEEKFPVNTVTILGIEIISVKECKTIIEKLGINDKEPNRILQNASETQVVNPCLIIVKRSKKKCLFFLQFKITHSKYQGNLDNIKNLLSSDFIYYFKSKNLSFIILICSDFFNRAPGSLMRIIDEIDCKISEKALPLDFIINIQHNPSPDDHLFLQSLNRIYGDKYGYHGHLCTIFLNSILPGTRKGGLSKVIFHKDLKLPETQPLKQIDAPVVGYEFPESEMLIHFSFDRLPKSWDPKMDVYPLHYKCSGFVDNTWRHTNIRYIAPMEKETSLDFQTYEELAYRLSDLGKFDRAREWANKAKEHWCNEKNYLKAASMGLFVAIQYRHQGKFRESLENYASAESLILKVPNLTPKSKRINWRIEAGRAMVKGYLIEGDCEGAYKKYDKIIKEIDDYLGANQQIDDNNMKKLKLYKIHAIRQKAEMLRLLGRYNNALKLFRKAYKEYNYFYAEEKAYSALGQGNCLRMLGKFDNAMEKYEEAMQFAQEKRSKPLQVRVLRYKAELYRTNGQNIVNLLKELWKLSEEINYFFGKLYYFLIKGGQYLTENIEKAEEFFEEAKKLAHINGEHLKIEYAHSIFGLAEVKRLKKDIKAANYYNKAHGLFKETGVRWGIEKTKKGIDMANDSSNEILFINIP